jgi:hypothetical protein
MREQGPKRRSGRGLNTAVTRKFVDLVCPSLQAVFEFAVSILLSATAAVGGSFIIEFLSDEFEALAQAMIQVRSVRMIRKKMKGLCSRANAGCQWQSCKTRIAVMQHNKKKDKAEKGRGTKIMRHNYPPFPRFLSPPPLPPQVTCSNPLCVTVLLQKE